MKALFRGKQISKRNIFQTFLMALFLHTGLGRVNICIICATRCMRLVKTSLKEKAILETQNLNMLSTRLQTIKEY